MIEKTSKSEDIEEQPQRVQPFQPPVFSRPILATQDTYDQNTQVEHLLDPYSTGTRPVWNTPNVAVINEKVGTIKSSAVVNSVTPSFPSPSGIFPSPTTALTAFTVIPNMAQVIKASGPVQINFSLTCQTVNANDPAQFAIYRNGVQVSQIFIASAGAGATSFSVSGNYTDNPPLGYQVYDVRWAAGASTLTAVGKQRTLQLLNLRAQ